VREYTPFYVFAGKLPYVVMVALGAAILAIGFDMALWAWVAAGLYIAYGIAGPFWMIMSICPHCRNYGKSCACGYGLLAAKLRPRGKTSLFGAKFRKHIPTIVPLWIIPVVAGGVAAALNFSRYGTSLPAGPGNRAWWLLALVAVFVLEAFVVLPLVSAKCECSHCLQQDECPWTKVQGAGGE
jgi:hypothetical protein